ncbi:response regulator transcription factor [Pseudorhodoferax sp. Leaf265]|uniref:response regulator transcription factor n=1 Tax=Pseudorhodoferax sp. Leaf265 TaxID=1736315 RepID=UPI0006FBEEB7|nr:response regulator transcription factor [Pseudorhodoferax sp. Leaf265]KQP02226.1 LuxR family transcriptional regulator [Pseudorhodoferax sp. Leaf265]PZP97487.1 MAG: DNA-binding response regulator [Variovorax paradoxus]PZQ08924.1 MAG: DNA-binding response regulator [Variovorax paradoxus]
MKLLLIDDHPLFSVGFAHALSHARAGVQVLTAAGVEDGLALAGGCAELDIALIDYRLAAIDGLEGLRRFGAAHPLVARVLISGDETTALAARARAAGAAGFIGKSLAIDQILHALDTVCAGQEWFGPRALAAFADIAGPGAPTARQLEVLALVATGQQNKQIADALGIAERTVKLHVTALLDSFGAHNRTHLLVLARERGLL